MGVGDMVEANVGKYTLGKVIAVWDEGNAYRVELQNTQKQNVWAPVDIDGYIRPLAQDKAYYQFRTEERVRIHGLKSMPEWNGKVAKIMGRFGRKKKRWPVEFTDDEGKTQKALLKADNL